MQKSIKTVNRNTSIELLRIISMLMILFHHFGLHGGFTWDSTSVTIPRLWYYLIVMGGKIGVNLFVLISGYFLIESKSLFPDFRKCMKIIGQVFFYSITIYIFFIVTGNTEFSMIQLIKTMFPITFSTWWFASTYFVLYLVHPFLNRLFNTLNKKDYQGLLILIVFCWSVIPTFLNSTFQSNSLIWFITLYAIAGYEKKFGFNKRFSIKTYFFLFFLFFFLTYFSSVVFAFLGTKYSFFSSHIIYLFGQEKINILLVSLTLFLAFTKLKCKYCKSINVIASATFGVYLIHDNYLIRDYLWIDFFKNASFQNSFILIPYSICVVLFVYVTCTIVDLLRKFTVEKIYLKYVNKLFSVIVTPFNIFIKNMINCVFGSD